MDQRDDLKTGGRLAYRPRELAKESPVEMRLEGFGPCSSRVETKGGTALQGRGQYRLSQAPDMQGALV